ncbi:MAG: riboflavin synthase [bacterium]
MFTGLVEEVGTVRRLERRGDGGRLSIQARAVLEGTRLGDSIAVSGACLTVVELGSSSFVVDCMPETLSHTTLGRATRGAPVNLERSLALGARLGGHLVLGHVDAVAEVQAVQDKGSAWEVTVSLPEAVRGCVAPKGSIAVDGISLTVIAVDAGWFRVGIIPHTLKETTLRNVRAGLQVNLEADVLARYVLQTLQVLGLQAAGPEASLRTGGGASEAAGGRADKRPGSSGGLTEELLREQGFA